MRLDLREIIEVPGGSLPFTCELDTGRLDFPSVRSYRSRPHAQGRVYNEAGILRLEGTLTAEMLCVCDRCGTEFDSVKVLPLDMETKFLCREDCKGLCPTCGKNLNLGPCGCRKQTDPRFAVLEQLLDKE